MLQGQAKRSGSLRKMKENHPTMDFGELLNFCKNFAIVPDLLDMVELQDLFALVNADGEYVASCSRGAPALPVASHHPLVHTQARRRLLGPALILGVPECACTPCVAVRIAIASARMWLGLVWLTVVASQPGAATRKLCRSNTRASARGHPRFRIPHPCSVCVTCFSG